MARIRSVKPELCSSETMAGVSAEVERTFVRLWTHCDDEGRAKDHPKLLKAQLFPLHDDVTAADVDRHLDDLVRAGCIVRYRVDGERFLCIPSWANHQRPQKPQTSKIPSVETADEVVEPTDSDTSTRPIPEGYGPVVEGSGGVVVEGGEGAIPRTADPYAWATERIARLPEEADAAMGSLLDRYGEPFIREAMLTLHARKFSHASDMRTAFDRLAAERTDPIDGILRPVPTGEARPRPAEFTGFAYERGSPDAAKNARRALSAVAEPTAGRMGAGQADTQAEAGAL